MSGIYIHIPFCKQSCNYCDFHFSTSLKYKTDLVKTLVKEIELRKNDLAGRINTIYFGGGTPSLLDVDELKLIIDSVYKHYNVASNIELTLECNPDDLSQKKLKDLKTSGVNRLSIGVQSFDNEELKFFNRAHNSSEAEGSIKRSCILLPLLCESGIRQIPDLNVGLYTSIDDDYTEFDINGKFSTIPVDRNTVNKS